MAFSTLWSDPRNWSSGGSPYGDPNATLEFPASSVARFTSTHDRPGTVPILQIVLQSEGYTLNGNPINKLGLIQSLASGSNRIDFRTINLLGLPIPEFTVTEGGTLDMRSIIVGSSSALAKTGEGKLVLSANSTFTQGVLMQVGTLVVARNTALGSGPLNLYGGTVESSQAVQLSNRVIVTESATIGGSNGLSFLTASNVQILAGKTLTVANTSGQVSFNGILFGPGSLAKRDNGVLFLGGVNTHEGGTEIHGGTVFVTNGRALGRGTLKLSGGVLEKPSASAVTVANAFEVRGGTIYNYGTPPSPSRGQAQSWPGRPSPSSMTYPEARGSRQKSCSPGP